MPVVNHAMTVSLYLMWKMPLMMNTRRQTVAIQMVDRKWMMPVFVLILTRGICRLSFSAMKWRFLFFCA